DRPVRRPPLGLEQALDPAWDGEIDPDPVDRIGRQGNHATLAEDPDRRGATGVVVADDGRGHAGAGIRSAGAAAPPAIDPSAAAAVTPAERSAAARVSRAASARRSIARL